MAESSRDISGLGLEALKVLLVQALEDNARLKAETVELREEIARLKGLTGRPKLRPSGMEQASGTHMMLRNAVGHCGHELFPRGWVEHSILGLITTVTHHDLHHEHGPRNFGLYFTWWDRWMETEHPEYRARVASVAAGKADGKASTGCLGGPQPILNQTSPGSRAIK